MRHQFTHEFRKPGWRPPEYLLERLRRSHPRVSIAWQNKGQRWGLVERGIDGEQHLITWLLGRPTINNTVCKLNQSQPSRWTSQEEFEAYLDVIEAPNVKHEADAENAVTAQLEDASDRLFHAIAPPVSRGVTVGFRDVRVGMKQIQDTIEEKLDG